MPWADPLRSAPTTDGLAAAGALALAAVVVGVLLAAAAATPARSLLAWVAAVSATAGVITAAVWVPEADDLVAFTPWLAVWPFDPDDVAVPTLAREISLLTRLASMAAWTTVGVVAAAVVRRLDPYPNDERRRTRRTRPRRFPP